MVLLIASGVVVGCWCSLDVLLLLRIRGCSLFVVAGGADVVCACVCYRLCLLLLFVDVVCFC